MKSLEYITHGTTSENDAEKIQNDGFEAQEGRATVSGDLIYAFEWATKKERRKGSKSESQIDEVESGRVIILKVPEDKTIDYATHTNIEINETSKQITGYSSKFESGRRQLAIYNEGEVAEKREKIEQAKLELQEIGFQLQAFLGENNIDAEQIKSKKDLVDLLVSFDLDKQISILKKVEGLERQKATKRIEAEPDISITPENILISVVPTQELGDKLNELQQKIKKLEKADLEKFTEEISAIIKTNKDNFISPDLKVEEVVSNLLSTTMEAEVINMVRSISFQIKIAQGFAIYNRGEGESKEKSVDKKKLREKLETIKLIVEAKDFDIGMENLNRYLRININKMLAELSG